MQAASPAGIAGILKVVVGMYGRDWAYCPVSKVAAVSGVIGVARRGLSPSG